MSEEKTYFALQYVDYEGESITNHGIYQTKDSASQAIFDWWDLNEFKPKYIRSFTDNNGDYTIDYGLHYAFYKIKKIKKENFYEVLTLGVK